MKNLGLTEDVERKISLKKEFLKSPSTKIDSNNFLYEFMLKKLIDPAEASACKQRELPLYLVVLLSMDPYEPIQWSGDKFIRRKTKLFEEDIKILEKGGQSDAALQNFVYWSKYLGFLSFITEKYFIPDPTEVIAKNLPYIFTSNKLLIDEFQSHLGENIPVLEGGSVRKDIESKLKTDFQREEKHFSKSTSLALKRLEKRGVLELEHVSDAHNWILDLGKTTQKLTHIKYNKGN